MYRKSYIVPRKSYLVNRTSKIRVLFAAYCLLLLLTAFVMLSGVVLVSLSNQASATPVHITISSGCKYVMSGNGILSVSGNLTVNGTFSASNTSTIKFCGTALQQISGSSGVSSFQNVELNNSAGLYISADISISNTLLMSAGDFDLRNNNVNLGTTGSLSSETSAKRIKATDGTTDGRGTGTIYTTQTLGIGSYTNIAGLGININTATNFGSTTIKRGHLRQQGTGTYSSNYSIYRYYEIIPTGKTINYGTVTLNYFSASELNGHTDNQLVIFQYVQVGAPSFWKPLETTNTSPQAVATTVSNSLANIKLTCGSNSSPLPIELINFTATCISTSSVTPNGVEGVQLHWVTASETNNNYFTVEKCKDEACLVSNN